MARNSTGILMARQLLGNRNKFGFGAALLLHNNLTSNSFQTLAQIPPPPTNPSNPKPFTNSLHNISNLHFHQYRPISSPAGPSNIVVIKSEDGFNKAISKVEDGASPALFYFTAVWCGPCRFISPVIGELNEQYPHVTTYKIDIDEEGLVSTLGKLNISSVPTFHFFQDGKKVAEVVGADVTRLRDTFSKLYKQE